MHLLTTEEDKALVLIANDFERSAQAIADLQVIVAIIVYLLHALLISHSPLFIHAAIGQTDPCQRLHWQSIEPLVAPPPRP
ncbi:hypothetical protein [Nitrosomonas communis]|uniref:Uncharacterized protein n=1 Tax=Nitrosomonas communis TaxID=44574 RepID=A0A1H2SGS9_9PROT|nr:hypothetical protein [Nitrosomonas communis]SDW30698.1 hypothetical protein SAMN05421882_100745 [Nitrosomonas communis]